MGKTLEPIILDNPAKLAKSYPIWKQIDIYEAQAKELREIMYSKKISKGKWIYFPWSGDFVHLVKENEYDALRTNRNKNLINTKEQKILQKACIGFAGLSVGSGIATTLAYQGIANTMKLAEFDTLETTNLNRMKAKLVDIGKTKLDITMQHIYDIHPYAKLIPFSDGITKKNLQAFIHSRPKPQLLFEIIDDFEMKIRLRLEARKARIPVIMMANLGDNILIDIERYDQNPRLTLFNGILGNLPEHILEKPDADTHNYALDIVGINNVPRRALESVLEIGKTLVGRPQLGSTVTVGNGIGAYLARRILLGQPLPSGRYKVALDDTFSFNIEEKKANNIKLSISETQPNYAPWKWDYQNFPENEPEKRQISFFLEAGILATNIHNTQPWLFHIHGNAVDILPNKKYHLPLADKSGKNLYISLGCCISNIEIAASFHGYDTELILKKGHNTSFAQLTFRKSQKTNSYLATLAPFIAKRYSNKQEYDKRQIDSKTLKIFQSTHISPLVRVSILQNPKIVSQAGILQRNAMIGLAQIPGFNKELAAWLRENDTTSTDGMPGFVVGLAPEQAATIKHAIETNPEAILRIAGREITVMESSPAIGLIAGKDSNPKTWIDTGRTYQHLALLTLSHGVSMTPMQSAAEEAPNKLMSLYTLENLTPMMFFRMGYAKFEGRHTPRRLLKDFLI